MTDASAAPVPPAEEPIHGELAMQLTAALQRVPETAGRRLTLTPLSGGITNRNFLVTIAGEADRYVIRLAGNDTHLLGISRAVADLAARARSKKLNPEEVQGGTFTITNPGIFGALYGLPVINQPQVAILGVGSIDKRPVVIDDAIAVHPVCHLTLGYDHRLIDGADAGRFLAFLKERLENFEA